VSHTSVRKIVVKMLVPAAKPSQSRVTTSSSAALSASSTACSISGRAVVRSRPIHVSPGLQRIRGPYPIAAGIAAYGRHAEQYQRQATQPHESPAARKSW
jgi:hypothetical protein